MKGAASHVNEEVGSIQKGIVIFVVGQFIVSIALLLIFIGKTQAHSNDTDGRLTKVEEQKIDEKVIDETIKRIDGRLNQLDVMDKKLDNLKEAFDKHAAKEEATKTR